MEDLFDAGYVVFIILIFVFSIIKNMAKNKKRPPAQPPKKKPPIAPEGQVSGDFIERKLAELLGLDVSTPATPKPKSVVQPIPESVPPTSQTRAIPESSEFSMIQKKEKPKKKKRVPPKKSYPPSLHDRIIWAEILAPPRSRRRGRVI